MFQLVDKIPNLKKIEQTSKNVNQKHSQLEERLNNFDHQIQQLTTFVQTNYNRAMTQIHDESAKRERDLKQKKINLQTQNGKRELYEVEAQIMQKVSLAAAKNEVIYAMTNYDN